MEVAYEEKRMEKEDNDVSFGRIISFFYVVKPGTDILR